jgi:tetraacyldisaccharide 4'-kinase
VGNLSTGGTGKTPMIEWILANFHSKENIAVLSRGYKRKTRGFVQVTSKHTAEDVGDEPLQIFKKFPKSTVVVDANRRRGIARLEQQFSPGLILLDDAYQHRKVKASSYVLLTSFSNLYSQDWYLPTGNLRDSKKEAKRADTIIVTKCPLELNTEGQAKIIDRLNPKPFQEVLFCGFEYDSVLKGIKECIDLGTLGNRKITVVTGIANADLLISYLETYGLELEHMEFPDHHFFTDQEIRILSSKPMIITTEKDFTRMGGKVQNAFYLEVRHLFLGDGKKAFLRMMEAL